MTPQGKERATIVDTFLGKDQKRRLNLGPLNVIAYGVRRPNVAVEQKIEPTDYLLLSLGNFAKDAGLGLAAGIYSADIAENYGLFTPLPTDTLFSPLTLTHNPTIDIAIAGGLLAFGAIKAVSAGYSFLAPSRFLEKSSEK